MSRNYNTITNYNSMNQPSEQDYDSFNKLIFSGDCKILGKFLHRYHFYHKVRHLPGDIVEVGVFKGSGVASFCKILNIFEPNSNRKVIGFDFFSSNDGIASLRQSATPAEVDLMTEVYERARTDSELELVSVEQNLIRSSGRFQNRSMLVSGDIATTMPAFVESSPGFRASLIYIDVDLAIPTYYALKSMWNRLLPGGIVLFDEYEYHGFTESEGVERFLREFEVDFTLESTHWIAPTAYLQKP
jgi:hypothetical protein